jgi:hypothetical protein
VAADRVKRVEEHRLVLHLLVPVPTEEPGNPRIDPVEQLRMTLPISPRRCSPAMATALLRSLEVQSTAASHRSTMSADASTGTPHWMSSRLNAACMQAWAPS